MYISLSIYIYIYFHTVLALWDSFLCCAQLARGTAFIFGHRLFRWSIPMANIIKPMCFFIIPMANCITPLFLLSCMLFIIVLFIFYVC